MTLAILLYGIALFAQILTTYNAIILFFRAKKYRWGCGLLALGFALMIGRRISPILSVLYERHFNFVDATLSVLISVLMLLGILHIRKMIVDLEEKNFLLDQFSKVDSLTGALRRSETFSRARMEIERGLRSGHPTSFLMLDIDHFKKVNDQYGHPCGDSVLVDLAKHCREQLRVIDILGRVGGEEFLIVLPESSQEDAYEVAERLRQYVAGNFTLSDDHSKIFITISIGISTYDPRCFGDNDPATILKTFYKTADQAMYKAKCDGRNKTVIWNQ